jgi:hypothetical protein
MLLLSRVPELPDVLSITRGQTLIFFITLLVAELGVSPAVIAAMHACSALFLLTRLLLNAAALPARRAPDARGARCRLPAVSRRTLS